MAKIVCHGPPERGCTPCHTGPCSGGVRRRGRGGLSEGRGSRGSVRTTLYRGFCGKGRTGKSGCLEASLNSAGRLWGAPGCLVPAVGD